MRVGSLFAGVGGFDLAARWMGWDTAWYSEIDPYACAVMRKHFPNAVNHGDVTRIDGRQVAPVDLLCGGFPCQDISLAGKGAGIDGARSGLWSHYARLIDEVRPRWVVAENVSALRSRGLDRVLGSLAALGYDAEWHCIPAAYVGAPHRRDRIWIVAYPDGLAQPQEHEGAYRQHKQRPALGRGQLLAAGFGAGGRDFARLLAEGDARRVEAAARDSRNGAAPVADAAGDGRLKERPHAGRCGAGSRAEGDLGRGPGGGGGWWDVEPDICRVADGVPARVDRLKCLGNAVVPQVPLLIFNAIDRVERAAAARDAA